MHELTEYTIHIRVTRQGQECMKKEIEPNHGEPGKSLQMQYLIWAERDGQE